MKQSWWRSHGSGRIFQRLSRGIDRVWGWRQRVCFSPPPAGVPARRRPGAVSGVWGWGLAVGLLATPVGPAQAGWFCPWAGPGCSTRRMDVACSTGAQKSTVATAYVLASGRAFDGEIPVPCGTGFVLHQFNGVEADDWERQTAIALNIKVRGSSLLTSCQTWWPADNLHGEHTVVCAGGSAWVAVTIHPAE